MSDLNLTRPFNAWSEYPLGTKAFCIYGGFWEKVDRGWKWCTGDTFPTPGGSVSRLEIPANET